MNQRPSGMTIYVGPVDTPGDILSPLKIQPDNDTYLREIRDEHLPDLNREEFARCLMAYRDHERAKGTLAPGDTAGVLAKGRW